MIRYAQLERAGMYRNGFTGPRERPREGDVVSSYNNEPSDETIGKNATSYETQSCSQVKPLGCGKSISRPADVLVGPKARNPRH